MDERALKLAILFHETYERLAPSFGYETRPDTKAFNPSTPNGRLMIAVCGELQAALHPSEAAPSGWKLVPVEPTDGMLAAVWSLRAANTTDTIHDTYRAMLVASPEMVGWCVVPKNPTKEMLDAGYTVIEDTRGVIKAGYRAMLAAAPVFEQCSQALSADHD